MKNNDLLAFQYALGLLNKTERQVIEKTPAFKQSLQKWQLHLTKLSAKTLLNEQSCEEIWQKISAQIQQGTPKKLNVFQTWLAYWRYLLGGFGSFGLILSVALFNQTANAELGWDIVTDLSKQQLIVTTTTHQHIDNKNNCTLWVKQGGKILRIGLMPEKGKKILPINNKALAMLKGGEMIISFENKKNPSPPSKPAIIDYQEKWII